jgi:hypothetical protein
MVIASKRKLPRCALRETYTSHYPILSLVSLIYLLLLTRRINLTCFSATTRNLQPGVRKFWYAYETRRELNGNPVFSGFSSSCTILNTFEANHFYIDYFLQY